MRTCGRCGSTGAPLWSPWTTGLGDAGPMELGRILARLKELGDTPVERLEVVVERT